MKKKAEYGSIAIVGVIPFYKQARMRSRVIVARYRYDCSPCNGSVRQTIESTGYDGHRRTGAAASTVASTDEYQRNVIYISC